MNFKEPSKFQKAGEIDPFNLAKEKGVVGREKINEIADITELAQEIKKIIGEEIKKIVQENKNEIEKEEDIKGLVEKIIKDNPNKKFKHQDLHIKAAIEFLIAQEEMNELLEN